jgi:tetratricopeptide (TPR) repeat protein
MDLIKITLGDKSIPPDVQQILLSRGQGNPFFLQEISRAILDVMANQAGRVSELLERLELPDTVQDAILMHIDRLPEPEKLTLKVAAVIGVRFQRSLLSAVHPVNGTRPQLPSQLQDLENEKLIRMAASAPKWEYVFRNVITQEIVYEGLLLAQRRQLHTAVGAALRAYAPDAIENLAYHYSRSDDWEMALHYLKMAGQKASREYANHAAIGYYSEILARLADRPDVEGINGYISVDYWDLLLERSKLYNLTGQRDYEVEDLGTLGLIAEVLGDKRRRALAAKQWAYHYETRGDYGSALELTERFVLLAKEANDQKLVGEGYNQWGKLLYIFRDYSSAQRYLQQAFRLAQLHHDDSAQADCLNNLGLVAQYQADYEVAQYFFKEAVQLWRGMGDQLGLGVGLRHLGQVYFEIGRYVDALQCFNESLKLHTIIGDPNGEALTRHNLGHLHRSLGDYDEARLFYQQALQSHRSTGDRRAEAHTLYHLGFLHCRLAQHEEALGFLDQALAMLREEFDDPWALGRALIYYSWTLIEMGRLKEAQLQLQEAMKTESTLHQEATLIECAVQLGRVALARNDLELARTCARHALDFVERKGVWGLEHPTLLYLTSYHILQASQESYQAQLVLQQAQRYVEMQAAQIEEPHLRHCYLTQIRENQEIQTLTG